MYNIFYFTKSVLRYSYSHFFKLHSAALQLKDCLTEYVLKLINLADFEAKKLQPLKTSDTLNLISFTVPDSIGY